MPKPKGITIILYEQVQTGVDDFNAPIYSETAIQIDNVLIRPGTDGGEDMPDTLDLTARKAIYTLAIPKGDTHSWENKRVEFFGKSWKAIGIPTEGIEDLIPLQWNRKVRVEAIE